MLRKHSKYKYIYNLYINIIFISFPIIFFQGNRLNQEKPKGSKRQWQSLNIVVILIQIGIYISIM